MEAEWRERFERWAEAEPDLAREWRSLERHELPRGWSDPLPSVRPSARSYGDPHGVGQGAERHRWTPPSLVGGSADLAPSTDTYLQGFGDVSSHCSYDYVDRRPGPRSSKVPQTTQQRHEDVDPCWIEPATNRLCARHSRRSDLASLGSRGN
jgi:hypothetical protein